MDTAHISDSSNSGQWLQWDLKPSFCLEAQLPLLRRVPCAGDTHRSVKLGYRRRRQPSIKPALGQCSVFVEEIYVVRAYFFIRRSQFSDYNRPGVIPMHGLVD